MAAQVDFGTFRAIIRTGRWRLVSARDHSVGKMMIEFLQDLVPEPSASIPDLDRWAAQDAAQKLGGRIISCDPLPKFDPTVLY